MTVLKETKNPDKNKLFRNINIGLAISLLLFVFLDQPILGMGIVFTLMGMLSMLAFYYNTQPLGISVGGFDSAMRWLLKGNYNRYFNLFWGLVQLILGVAALIHVAG